MNNNIEKELKKWKKLLDAGVITEAEFQEQKEKILNIGTLKSKTKERILSNGSDVDTESLLKRMFLYLEDGEWTTANEYCEVILDREPENAQAYLGKLMTELHVKKQMDLQKQSQPFDKSPNYQKVIRFADEGLRKTLESYINDINVKVKNETLESKYNHAKAMMERARTNVEYEEVSALFNKIIDYKDSKALATQCLEMGEIARKDTIYSIAEQEMKNGDITNFENAIEYFKAIPNWKDSNSQIDVCKKRIEELKKQQEIDRIELEHQMEIRTEKRKKNKKIIFISSAVLLACAIILVLSITVFIPKIKYNKVLSYKKNKDYKLALEVADGMEGYQDIDDQVKDIKYLYACELLKNNAKLTLFVAD